MKRAINRPGVWPGKPGGYVAGAALTVFDHPRIAAAKCRAETAFGTPNGTMPPLNADKATKRRER